MLQDAVVAVRNDQRNGNYTHNSKVPWVQLQEQHFQVATKYVLHAMLQNDATLHVLQKHAAQRILKGFDDASEEKVDEAANPAAQCLQPAADAAAEKQPAAASVKGTSDREEKTAKKRRRSELDRLLQS
jgi:hypothetical protein